jgi:hypothetical protein
MWVFRQLAAVTLIAVQLLQGVLPAVGDCATMRQASGGAAVAESAAAEPGHAHHTVRAAVAPTPGDDARPHDHEPGDQSHTPADCAMAMMCANAGVVSRMVVETLPDGPIRAHRTEHPADRPASLDLSPEPPPPRR